MLENLHLDLAQLFHGNFSYLYGGCGNKNAELVPWTCLLAYYTLSSVI